MQIQPSQPRTFTRSERSHHVIHGHFTAGSAHS